MVCVGFFSGVGALTGCLMTLAGSPAGRKWLFRVITNLGNWGRPQNTLPADKDNEDDRDIPWAMPADKR